jgi:hypothetical protein
MTDSDFFTESDADVHDELAAGTVRGDRRAQVIDGTLYGVNLHTGKPAAHRCTIDMCLLYLLTPWCRILFEKLIVTQLVNEYPAFFMEPEGSLPCSQKPVTGPYPAPAESSSPHRFISP